MNDSRAFDDPDRAELAEVLGAAGVWMLLDHPVEPSTLPRTGAELSAVSIQAHMAKRRQCPDYGIGDHDCSEHEAE